ncbi:hypothetical protein [Synechococcus sp. PCC 6312]|uniref:hypothetical protein n=1 Tax=Synechococcus sp. (strain ATCC 27167 / PCC 6312) TaxID=195253 RepID=UPI00029F2EC5|nr:hypothetical protein [Synechococcus sp. PCC 6312]AFY60101.1 hypothetical protein Syn6312_0893 [Synechococcus sp. PCC 6312]
MSNQTPWSKEQCRNRYVHDSKIGLRALAVESGVSFKTLSEWSAKDDWPGQRQQFQDNLRTQTDKRVESKLAMSRAELSVEHFESHRQARRVAQCLLGIIEDKAQQVQSNHPELVDPEQLQETVKQLFLHVGNINQLSMVIDRAVEGERKAAGLEYEDLHKAAAILRRRGFDVVVADNTELVTLKPGTSVVG